MDSIINIPIIEPPPEWKSSTPTPIKQLNQLGSMSKIFVSEFRDYNYSQQLADFIKNKRIAYVCPSPHLKNLGMGSYIDSHDIVIRVNQAYHMTEDNWNDYGKRTDILINCLNVNKRMALKKNPDFTNSLKFIICPMVNVHTLPKVAGFLEQIDVPSHNVCDGYLFKVFEQVGTTCNTGLMGIITLLNYDIESIYVTGMSFFNMNSFGKIYNDRYYEEAAKNNNFKDNVEKEPSIKDLRIDIHQQQPQIDYFSKMLHHHYPTKLVVDNYLIENFNLKVDKR